MNHCKIHIQEQRHSGGGKQTMETEIEVTEPQAKEHLEPLDSGLLRDIVAQLSSRTTREYVFIDSWQPVTAVTGN